MSIPVSRYSRNPISTFDVATLRRWYWGEYPWLNDIHRYAIYCELKRRDYPLDLWPVKDPFLHLTTGELRAYLPKLEDAGDRIAAHAVRDEIQNRGDERRASKDAIHLPPTCRGSYRYSFAPC